MRKLILSFMLSIIVVGSINLKKVHATSCNIPATITGGPSYRLLTSSGGNVTDAYYKNTLYVKDIANVKVQFGLDMTPSTLPGNPRVVEAKLKVNGSYVSVPTYNTEWNGNTVEITSDDSSTFRLRTSGATNTISMGGRIEYFNGNTPIACSEAYSSVSVVVDSSAPQLTIEGARGIRCKLSDLKKDKCKLTVLFKGRDSESAVKTGKLTLNRGSKVKTFTLGASDFDNRVHSRVVSYKDFGITKPGTYDVDTKLEGKDVVGHTKSTQGTARLVVEDDSKPSNTPTPTPTPTTKQNQKGNKKSNKNKKKGSNTNTTITMTPTASLTPTDTTISDTANDTPTSTATVEVTTKATRPKTSTPQTEKTVAMAFGGGMLLTALAVVLSRTQFVRNVIRSIKP